MKKIYLILTLMFVLTVNTVFAQLGDIKVHGFLSQGYLQSSDNNFLGRTAEGTFEFNEFGINFSSEVSDNLRLGVQLFARDLGYLDNDKILVDWAYGDYRLYDWLGIRAGKMKMPVGLYNEYRDLDMLRTNILMPQGVYNESWRNTFNAVKGVGIYGAVGAGFLGAFNYQTQIGVLNLAGEGGLNKYIEDQLFAHFTDYNLSTTYVANVNWETPLKGLRLGASVFMTDVSIEGATEDTEFWRERSIGAAQTIAAMDPSGQLAALIPNNTYAEAKTVFLASGMDLDLVNRNILQTIDNIRAYWFSGEYVWNSLTLAGEYFVLYADLETTSPGYGAGIDPTMEVLRPDFENELGGFYGSVGYQITDALAASAYYSEYYPDKSDKNGDFHADLGFSRSFAWLKDTAVSVKYDVNTNWTLKAEAHLMDGTAVTYRADQEDPSDMAKNWTMFATKLTYNF